MSMNMYRNISPFDHRYYRANEELFESLRDYLSEEANIRSCARVEGALLKSHIHFSSRFNTQISSWSKGQEDWDSEIDNAVRSLSASDVYEEEELTRHQIRALVRVLQRNVPRYLRHFVHLGATSADIIDTALALRMRDCMRKVIVPQLIRLEEELIAIASKNAEILQVGRTHGQFAVPITLGHAFAEYISRLGKSICEIEIRSLDLRGSLSGAVGAYNALSILYDKPQEFEEHFLGLLGLRASDHSTQIVQPEYMLRLLLELNTAFGILANLADDLRHLQRSEIDELREFFSDTQVGSSTMPQKRNPWNCEHVKSMWKNFSPHILSMCMDQISEHQRDLSNSASARFVPEYIAGFSAAVDRMTKILASLSVNKEAIEYNVRKAGSDILAEALYIILAQAGRINAHETIRNISMKAYQKGILLEDELKMHKEEYTILSEFMKKRGMLSIENFLSDPIQYSGRSSYIARKVSSEWKEKMIELKRKLQ